MSDQSLKDIFENQTLERRYRIVRLLAEGNFGAVFHAELVIFDEPVRQVALKISKATHLTRESAKQVFAEAITLAQVYDQIGDVAAREFIVPVFDMGILEDYDSRGFIVMELISSASSNAGPRTLESDLADHARGMPHQVAVSHFSQICRGMAAVHDLGVVHRDLKPDNVLLTPDGRIRIVDFGLAAGLNDLGHAEGSVGTHQYMAPETALSAVSEARSDVYSMGIILYEMLTGTYPFETIEAPPDLSAEEGVKWVIQQKAAIDFSPARENPTVPVWLDKLVSRCLKHEPLERPASAKRLLEELEQGESSSHAQSYDSWSAIEDLLAREQNDEALQKLSDLATTLTVSDDLWFPVHRHLALTCIRLGKQSETLKAVERVEQNLDQIARSSTQIVDFYEQLAAAAEHSRVMQHWAFQYRDNADAWRSRQKSG